MYMYMHIYNVYIFVTVKLNIQTYRQLDGDVEEIFGAAIKALKLSALMALVNGLNHWLVKGP